MITWIKKNKTQSLVIFLILFLALFLRTYRISEFMTFLGDEGRDVRIVRDLLRGNLVFIGPQTSVGNMYLGPLYYYLMAPALFLSGLNPVGPAILNALIGTFTVFLIWFLGRKWFGEISGNVAALLYALSPVAIIYSRSSWNPNPMPLFALLSIWGIYEVWQNHKYFLLPFIGLTFGAALQMHYLGLLLLPVIGYFWLLEFLRIQKNKNKSIVKDFIVRSVIGVLLFLLLMSPLFLFDLKHHWINSQAFIKLIFGGQSSINSVGFFSRVQNIVNLIIQDLFLGRVTLSNKLVFAIPFITSLWFLVTNRNKNQVKVLIVWLFFAALGLSFYKNEVYIHYLGFIYPAIYLLIGAQINYFFGKNKIKKIASVLAVLIMIYLSLVNSPARSEPNALYGRTVKVANLIVNESKGKPFNFGLIAKNNYDEPYRYLFENQKAQMVRGEDSIASQLFVVCEDGDACKPEGNSQYQIAIFGVAKVVQEWQVDYIKIYKLEHSK